MRIRILLCTLVITNTSTPPAGTWRRAATCAITSDSRDDIAAVLAENPPIRYFSNRRGYVRTRITPDELRADFRVVPFVSQPGADVRTGASFVVPDRAPALHAM
jgi:phosphodiesterase/alkaline phosphatase D-like protein